MSKVLPAAQRDALLATRIDTWLDHLERDRFDKGIAVNPLGKWRAELSSDFAERAEPVAGASGDHPAYDIIPWRKKGAPPPKGPIAVNAAVSGEVLFDGWYSGKSGRTIIVGGDNGRIYVYGHLDEATPTLTAGNRVERGNKIGHMGCTGKVSGPCLHFVERQLGAVKGEDGLGVYDTVYDKSGKPVMDEHTHKPKQELRRTAEGEKWNNMRYREAGGDELRSFRAKLKGGRPLSYDDFIPVAPTLGWNDQPLMEGSDIAPMNDDQLRHSRRYRAAHPEAQTKAVKHTPEVKDNRGWGEYLCDGLTWAVGMGEYACSNNPPQAKPKPARGR